MVRSRRVMVVVVAAVGFAVLGQAAVGSPLGGGRALSPNPEDPAVKAYAALRLQRLGIERELRQLRFKHFRSTRNTEIRQVGIAKLREFTDPGAFPLLLEIFAGEERDVRAAVLDHLMDQATPEGDASLAWGAVFDRDEWFRGEAKRRLLTRVGFEKDVPGPVQSVIAEGLSRERNSEVASAADLASGLNLIDAIPMLISAQVVQSPRGRAGETDDGRGRGALAYILVGQQTAFVSGLQPVVSNSAVAFNPTVGVVTDGVVLSVSDAVVTTYRTYVHASLVKLTSKAWGGRSTEHLGYEPMQWQRWYQGEFRAYREQEDARVRLGKATAEEPGPDAGPVTPTAR